MAKIGCCLGAEDAPQAPLGTPLIGRERTARAVAGAAFIAQAGVLYVGPVALLSRVGVPQPVRRVLAALGFWFGLSHLVAAATSYRGCPEVGAVASVVFRRRIVTTCKPWQRLDRRLQGPPIQPPHSQDSPAHAPTPV